MLLSGFKGSTPINAPFSKRGLCGELDMRFLYSLLTFVSGRGLSAPHDDLGYPGYHSPQRSYQRAAHSHCGGHRFLLFLCCFLCRRILRYEPAAFGMDMKRERVFRAFRLSQEPQHPERNFVREEVAARSFQHFCSELLTGRFELDSRAGLAADLGEDAADHLRVDDLHSALGVTSTRHQGAASQCLNGPVSYGVVVEHKVDFGTYIRLGDSFGGACGLLLGRRLYLVERSIVLDDRRSCRTAFGGRDRFKHAVVELMNTDCVAFQPHGLFRQTRIEADSDHCVDLRGVGLDHLLNQAALELVEVHRQDDALHRGDDTLVGWDTLPIEHHDRST